MFISVRSASSGVKQQIRDGYMLQLENMMGCVLRCSKADSREVCSVSYEIFGFKNSGLMIELRLLVGIGRSWVMLGRICLDMVS